MELMKSLNFAEVYDMLGGITDWEANGLPVIDATISPTTTAAELASFGGTLYDKTCTLTADCHSRFGQGGETEFEIANLTKYGNAETIFGIISSIMHLEIGDYQEDAPTQEEYLQILAYLLVQNGAIQPDDMFGRNILPNLLIE